DDSGLREEPQPIQVASAALDRIGPSWSVATMADEASRLIRESVGVDASTSISTLPSSSDRGICSSRSGVGGAGAGTTGWSGSVGSAGFGVTSFCHNLNPDITRSKAL